ncbi:MAG: hypothetical protein FJ276_05075, partial [Planctomycetes bacterium]|nr:hypothetical protein [Planctomycetota bacterium]
MYKFQIAAGQEGVFTAETFAERQPNSSLLDSYLTLYRENSDGRREVIARNDNYYSEDSYIELRLGAGTYYLGVTAAGNTAYNPEFENTGFGGKSQGPYDLRVEFRADPTGPNVLQDDRAGQPGTALDGDADGVPGGVYNFWFRAVDLSQTVLVDKANRAFEAGARGKFTSIADALNPARPGYARPGDIVRIVGNSGNDGNPLTLADNFGYEIGAGALPGQVLADGTTLNVPKGVTIMVDEGAIFKLNKSRIGVGSSSLGVDRSAGAFQVLGTPSQPVYFTSYWDETIGLDTHLPKTTPRPGDWGGIVYRNDLDNAEQRFNHEREGIFLNYVNHADIRYGGGNVVIDSIRQIVTPVQMLEARPTISFNKIRLSADAPLSADPDSFEETNFHAPKFQLKGSFTSDYRRVGPDIHGNLLVENSTNGMFVRITTPAGNVQKQLTVPGRFDDVDVVHVLSENLRIQGTPGDPILELARPPVTVVTLQAIPGGAMEAGNYRYKIINVDTNGFEGRPSEATSVVALAGANRSVRLDNLPPASSDFVARRLYRSVSGVAGSYVFVAQINASDKVYVDTASLTSLDQNNTLKRDVPTVQGVTVTRAPGIGIGILPGTYNYRITHVNSTTGLVSPSSDVTVNVVLTTAGEIRLNNLVPPNTNGYDRVRIYRSARDGDAPYTLAGEILANVTTFLDTGASTQVLSPESFGVARARMDARLAIDPGTVVKLEGSRIEVTFGAQLLAEGIAGREVIFTSRADDRYGAGGTFDTNGDGSQQTPKRGDWGGIYVGHLGAASIDHALLTFGGGVTKIEGTFKAFNILEIHQADARVANSVIEQNDNGMAGQGPADRFGRGYNEPATIYVRGAQPILVNNTIQNNREVAISINANSFTSDFLPDTGRSIGALEDTGDYSTNVGPLVRGNRMVNNPLNAIDIRGEVLTTMSVWDDTDIVHVLRGEQIIVPNFHTNVGLRLLSSPSSSLVVKLQGPGDNFDPYLGAGFTATGLPLEISDRIGGTLQIVGQPDFPVVLTSLRDDSIGAGLLPNGETLLDTNNDGLASLPRAGDWRSVRLEQYANDRNVELILESEARTATAPGENATPATAQFLGELAPFEQGGDENLRLGFDLHALLNEPNDIDVYSFNATAGTEVWIDIDRTTNTLNSVVELLDSNGTVVARSDNSLAETANPNLLYYNPAAIAKNDVNPLQRADNAFQPKHASGAPKDFYSLNTLDAGMRVVLPGVAGTRSAYYVRVRSSSNDLNNLNGGLTTGAYQLQVRLREIDEVPGCTVRYADIRYATNGVEAYGLPGHSPLLGESAEDEQVGGPENNNLFPTPLGPMLNNFNPATGPQDLGNLLATDRGVLSVAGVLIDKNDFDLYEVQVGYDKVGAKTVSHVSVVFDVDYADGLARPNTTLTVFDSTGRPILVGTDSNIADDRPAPLSVGGDMADLSRGSVGKLDPFIGPVSLPVGTYYVAVTSDNWLPAEVVSNSDVRRVPLNSVMRLTEDHFGGGTDFVSSVFGAIFDFDSIVNPGGNNYWDINADLGPPPGDGFLQTFDDSHGNNPRSFEAEPNDTIPTAQDLELELWTVGFDSNIEQSTVFPHVSIIDGKGDGTRDYYSFMVAVPGSQGIFDLDIDWDEILDPVDVMNGSMRLWDEWGSLLATSLDAGLDDGSPLPTDPMIRYTFPNAGRYIIEVTREHPSPFNLYYPPQPGDNYTLHVSIQNHEDEFTPTRVYAHEREPNDSFTQRQDLNSEIWSLNADPNITNAVLIPHVTVIDGSGDGTRDVYSFRVPRLPTDPPFEITYRRAIIDIDATVGMDASLRVFERTFFGTYVEVARSLDNDGDPGSPMLSGDPLIDQMFVAGRRYYIEVTRQQPGNDFAPPAVGDQYVLHVSLEDQPVGANINFHHVDTLTDNVTNASNTQPITITSATTNFCLTTGSPVTVTGVTGNTNANNAPPNTPATWSAVYVGPGVFQLQGRNGNADYTGGGRWTYTGNVIPGNSYGQVISKTFSLKGYTPEDRPVLYFSYFIDVLESLNEHQFNVYILAPDAGGNFQRVSRIASKGTNLLNIAEWRQARVDLGPFAGRDLQLEFEFAANTPCTWTLYEGVAVDDIIIGFAERGEIIVYADSNPTFAPNLFASGTGTLHGPYQLEIRQASQTGESQRPTPQDSISHVANRFFDTNDRLVQATTLKAPAGSAIVDGQTFTISDGRNALTFEYDRNGSVLEGRVAVPFTTADLAENVALSIRNAINSPAAQSILKVTAGLSEGTNSGPNTYNAYLVNLYGNAVVSGGGAGFVIYHNAFGDSNVFRDQGQLLIHSNFITDARDFGIIVDSGPRDKETDVPIGFLQTHAGSARNLRELNNQPDGGLVPGALIENNVIAGEGLGGIHVSGNFAPFEIVPPPDLPGLLSGQQVCDGNTITIHGYRTTVTFEFEDISGGSLPCGSGILGGNGWREGNIPIFYRQSAGNWLYPPRSIPPYAYTQVQMATTIRDAIQSSILVTNGTTMHLDANMFYSRWLRNPLTLAPLVATYVDHASTITSSTSAIRTRRVPVGSSAQPFHRVLNNTVYGNDGQRSFFPGSGLDESNDTMGNAVETHQGRQHHPESYITNGVIGDGVDLLNDASLDVDFYRFQMEVGERVTVDIDAAPLSTLDSYLRLFDAQGNLVAFNDNGMAPGETGSTDSFVDFTATKAGTYYVGVSGKGNEQYDPLSLGNRTGPASAGVYQINLNVIAPRTWVITARDGTTIPDGTTFTVSDIYRTVTYEFDDANAPGLTNPAHIAIPYNSSPIGTNNRGPGYRAPDMAATMANVIGQGLAGVTAVALGGYQGRSGSLPTQPPSIDGDTSFWGNIGFGHNTPLTPVNSSSELYVVVSGASSIKGSILLQPRLNENVDQLLPETGILVSERASPTLLNNVLANLNAGIWQDSSPTTVVGASLYQHNARADSNVGSAGDDFNITMGDYDPLFVNAANGEFYPAPFSRAIDSAIDSLEDRVRFAAVKNAMGIPVSPILAPDLDAVGLLRSDDPEVETPAGQGANVFKDRGALDRADFLGPDAVLIIPRDNDAAGVDLDPTPTVVQLAAGRYDKFEIQLVDGFQSTESGEGVGVNDATVDSRKVTVTADGKLLQEDVDYTFRYNATTNTIRLTPLAGAWENNRAYVITLPNEDQFVIQIPNGTQVRDSETFVITDLTGGTVTFEFESGFSLFVPETLTLVVPAVGKGPGGIQDGQRFVVRAGFLGQYRFEYDENTPPNFLPGNIPINIANISTADQLAQATVQALNNANIGVTARYLGNGQIHVGANATYSVDTSLSTLTQSGNPGVVAHGDTFIISDGISPPVRFEFTRTGIVTPGNVPVVVSNANTQDEIAQAIANAIAGSSVDMSPTNFGGGHVHLGGNPGHALNIAGSPNLTYTGQPGVRTSTRLIVPSQAAGAGGIADGQWFSIQNGNNPAVVFEWDNNGTTMPGSRPLLFTLTSTIDQLSNTMISAINLAGVGLTPQYLGAGVIALNDTIYHKTDSLQTNVSQIGVPGGVVRIDFKPDASFTEENFAPLIFDAIDNSLLVGVAPRFRGGETYYMEGIKSISGLRNFFIDAIKDHAGNHLQPNQASNQTRFTILMPGVTFDFGDAPASFGTLFADNGARHVVPPDDPLFLGANVTTEPEGQPSGGANADSDDGVDLSLSVFNEHLVTPIVVHASGRGFLDAWIDFNRDGDWNDAGEQIFVSQQLASGANNLSVRVPANSLTGETYARFRLSRIGGLSPAGVATDGEVEDYLIRIEPGIPPVAVADTGFATSEDAALPISPASLLANDTDADSPHGSLAIRRFDAISTYGAAISLDGSGNILYDPTRALQLQALNPGQERFDTFTYQITDGVLPSNNATVTIRVTGVNDAPVAVDDAYSTNENTTLVIAAIGVLLNDTDVDQGDTRSVSAYDSTSLMGAAVVMSANGAFTYNPAGSVLLQGLTGGATAT